MEETSIQYLVSRINSQLPLPRKRKLSREELVKPWLTREHDYMQQLSGRDHIHTLEYSARSRLCGLSLNSPVG
jgi:hypothetical protein